jgi:hypothetical protein
MPEIDDAFLDVDFRKHPRYIFGAIETPHFGDWQSYEDVEGVLTDAEIDEAIERMDAEGGGGDDFVTRIYDQDGEGSCVANACSQANEIVQCKQFGKGRVVHLSAISLYKRIGRSPSSGAVVSDGLDEMVKRGVLPLDNEANRARFGEKVMPNCGFRERYPDGWEDTAKLFRVERYAVVRSVSGLLSALCKQHPVVVGRQGHSICYCRPMRKSGRRVVKYANSWGGWGDGGFGYDSEGQIRQSSGWAFAVLSVTVPRAA